MIADYLEGSRSAFQTVDTWVRRELSARFPVLRHERADLLADHPEPREILAEASPADADVELTAARAAEVGRHVALCAACRQESAWLCGRAVARGRFDAKDRWRRWGATAALLAVGVLGGALGAMWRSGRSDDLGAAAGLTRLVLVTSAQRASGAEQVIAAPAGDSRLTLLFEVDLPAAGFPATFTLRTAAGVPVLEPETIMANTLFRGTYAALSCPAAVCPPGDYVALLQPAGAESQPVEYRFRLTGPQRK